MPHFVAVVAASSFSGTASFDCGTSVTFFRNDWTFNGELRIVVEAIGILHIDRTSNEVIVTPKHIIWKMYEVQSRCKGF